MSDQTEKPYITPGDVAEISNINNQRRIGEAIRSRIPGLSPYDTVRAAAAQLYPALNVSHDDKVGALDAGSWSADGLNGVAHVDEAKALSGPYAKLLRSQDQADYLTGLYAHEILGHGGDTWRTRGADNQYNTVDEHNKRAEVDAGHVGHFKDEPPATGGLRMDDVSFLDPQVSELMSPQAFSKKQALQDAQAKQEAMQRGLQTELPQDTKAKTIEQPGPGPQPVSDWVPKPFFPTAPSPYSVVKRLP